MISPTVPSRLFDVVIADDDANIRSALNGLLSDHPQLRVAGMAADGLEAADLCRDLRPQLAVVDVLMPAGGVVAIAAIRAVSPETIIVGYTAQADRRTRARLVEAGAAAVLAKGGGIDLPATLLSLVEERDASGRQPGVELR